MARKYGHYVNGQYVHGLGYAPIVGAAEPEKSLGEISLLGDASPEDRDILEAALEGAHQTFLQVRRGFFPLSERLDFLRRLQSRLRDQHENISLLLAREVGKPILLARLEAERGTQTLQSLLNVAPEFFASKGLAVGVHANWSDWEGWVLQEGRGPLLALTPFNYPLNLVLHKIAPAIAAGCPVVLKPSPKGALTALCLADFCAAEGLPPGMLNVVHAANELVPQIMKDSRLKQVSMTGSLQIARLLGPAAVGKPFFRELGGAAPAYVDESADLVAAAGRLVRGAFSYAGQVCISLQNVFAHRAIAPRLLELVRAELAAFPSGGVFSETSLAGPLIDAQAATRVRTLMSALQAAGARLETSTGARPDELSPLARERFVAPTLVTGLASTHAFVRDEAFAPLLGFHEVADFDAFLEIAESLPAKLQASVFTGDLGQGLRATRRLGYGGVIVNESPGTRLDGMPYGGRDDAGWGREGGAWGLADYCEAKSVLIKT